MIVCRSLESLLYAWRTQQKCVIINPAYIDRFNETYEGFNFEFMNANNAYELWANLSFCMSLTGLLVCPGNVENIREFDGEVKIATKGAKIFKLKTDKVVWFDSEVEDQFNVYDFFDVRSSKPHDIKVLRDEDMFVNKINFFPSVRPNVSQTKDLVAYSRMTHKQLLNSDWGNGIARLKIMRMMHSAGITGPLSIRTETKTYYKKPKIDFYKRISSKVLEPLRSFEEVYNMHQEMGDAWKTIQKLKVK